ncbi:MAG: phosphoribosyl-AMP cyclohydrolase, partial [Rickettsiales bacterium]|nr:phosphoribosyl-AMP cyclohydrolase [Rickettsiales bacterium]
MTTIITTQEVVNAQKAWGAGIEEIGRVFTNKGNYVAAAEKFIQEKYFFQEYDILFKPTLAQKDQFRIKYEDALSYFVASNRLHDEDLGFAIRPWHNIRFENIGITILRDTALTMG